MYKLFTDVFVSSGFNRGLIVDTTRCSYFLIPVEWAIALNNLKSNISEQNLKEKLSNDDAEECLDFLLNNEFIFLINQSLESHFPPFELVHESPYLIDAAFLIVSEHNIGDLIEMSNMGIFDKIGVIRFFVMQNVSLSIIEEILNILMSKNPIQEIFITLNDINYGNFSSNFLYKKAENLKISYHDFCIENTFFSTPEYTSMFPILSPLLHQVIESSIANVYNNKTIFIDEKGYIHMDNSFTSKSNFNISNIIENNLDILTIINKIDFKENWGTKLANVEICKECEFNSICIDCRPLTKTFTNWTKKDCDYNPFISKWIDEDGFLPSSSMGKYSERGKFIIDLDLVKDLNEKFWK